MRTYDIRSHSLAVKASLYTMFSVVIAFFLSITYYFSQWSKCYYVSCYVFIYFYLVDHQDRSVTFRPLLYRW